MIIKDFKVPESINEALELTVSLSVYKYLYGILKQSTKYKEYQQRVDFRHLYVVDALKFYFLVYLATTQFLTIDRTFEVFTKKFFSGFISEGRYRDIKKFLSDTGLIYYEEHLVKPIDTVKKKWYTLPMFSANSSYLLPRLETISNQSDENAVIKIKLSEESFKFFTDKASYEAEIIEPILNYDSLSKYLDDNFLH